MKRYRKFKWRRKWWSERIFSAKKKMPTTIDLNRQKKQKKCKENKSSCTSKPKMPFNDKIWEKQLLNEKWWRRRKTMTEREIEMDKHRERDRERKETKTNVIIYWFFFGIQASSSLGIHSLHNAYKCCLALSWDLYFILLYFFCRVILICDDVDFCIKFIF